MPQHLRKPSDLISVDSARAIMTSNLPELATEILPIAQTAGCYLAESLFAKFTHPPFNASAMDGYAIRFEDFSNNLREFEIVGETAAGAVLPNPLSSGQALRIFTGAPLPSNADCVVIQENCELLSNGKMRIHQAPKLQANIRYAGHDFKAESTLLARGARLTPQAISLAAASGHAQIPVKARPKISILSTGNELVSPGAPRTNSQIYACNDLAIRAMAEKAGAEILSSTLVPDELSTLTQAMQDTLSMAPDILLTSGGASVGEHDYVTRAITALGGKIDIHKIAVRPGKPVIFGRIGKTIILGLPGNPVSSLVSARLFLMPILAHLQAEKYQDDIFCATSISDIPANGPRAFYMSAKAEQYEDAAGQEIADNQWRITVSKRQDSSLLAATALCNSLVIRAPHAPAIKAGSPIKFMFL